jgi:hypothetical protein
MNQYLIRFNKSRGQPGRGTPEHVWRVFENGENGKEYLFKHLEINVNSRSKQSENGEDWNIYCEGILTINRETSTAIINNGK